MKVYIINRYSTFTSYSHCHFVSTSRKRAFTEYLDLLHQVSYNEYCFEHGECFLSKEFNCVDDFNHIDDWEEFGQINKEANYYDLSDKSRVRIEFIEVNTK